MHAIHMYVDEPFPLTLEPLIQAWIMKVKLEFAIEYARGFRWTTHWAQRLLKPSNAPIAVRNLMMQDHPHTTLTRGMLLLDFEMKFPLIKNSDIFLAFAMHLDHVIEWYKDVPTHDPTTIAILMPPLPRISDYATSPRYRDAVATDREGEQNLH